MRRLEKFLKENGISHMVGFDISPFGFICVSIMFSLIAIIVMLKASCNLKIVLLCGAFSLFIPGIILSISNNADNDDMLSDIKTIFEMLKIQVHSGVFIFDALSNCVTFLNNKRLINSLNKLLKDIYMSNDINECLDEFSNSFKNTYIDNLVIIIKQSQETGFCADNLDNAFKQIEDVERTINIKMENKTDRKVQVIQVMIMAGIIAVTVFCSVTEFKGIFEGL